MNRRKGFLIAIALGLMAATFFPWVHIVSRNISISGMQAAGTTYGKPGLFTLVLAGVVLLFALVPRVWAHRICIFAAAFNCGWAIRNFILLSACQGGECPQRQPAFYFYLLLSILLLAAVLLQDMKLKKTSGS